jgi:hypothetical protein
MYGVDVVGAAGLVDCASVAPDVGAAGSRENPFDCGPGGVNRQVSSSAGAQLAPGLEPSTATCLLSCMFRDEFANLIAKCSSINMCGRSLVGQCLHNLSLPKAQFDRRGLFCS